MIHFPKGEVIIKYLLIVFLAVGLVISQMLYASGYSETCNSDVNGIPVSVLGDN